MQYIIKHGLIRIHNESQIGDNMFLDILSTEEYKANYPNLVPGHLLIRSMERLKYCKVDIFRDYILGTLRIPKKEKLSEEDWRFGFYMDKKKLIFVGEPEKVTKIIKKTSEKKMVNLRGPAHLLFEFLECLIHDEIDFINEYEDELEDKENSMVEDVNEIPKDFEQYLLKKRKELMVLSRYYRQMAELGNALKECPSEIYSQDTKELFQYFADRMERFYSDVQGLKEYSLQIRDMYQARIDVRHNNVIQFLTLVTTIFMPLTLITGWYGMNFSRMPELTWKYGYGIVVLISVLLILIELWIFKKKKWL